MADAEARLERLFRGLRQRELMVEDPVGTAALDGRLADELAALHERFAARGGPALEDPPPRRIAVAMALAVLSQPHLVQTFSTSATPALLVSTEVLEQALGLSAWEIDELREEVDRRAGWMVKQQLMVSWLGTRPAQEQLVTQLFPGMELEEATVHFLRSQVVVTAKLPPTPSSALHLPWLGREDTGPLHAFRGRYVDAGLKRSMNRSLGLTEDEIVRLLERAVTLFPEASLAEWMRLERYRTEGFAGLTELGARYSRLCWLSTAEGHANRWREWIATGEGEARTLDPDRSFDTLLQLRVQGMLEALKEDILARRLVGALSSQQMLSLLDLGPHIDAVVAPLLRWARARGSAMELAQRVELELEEARTVLKAVHDAWASRARSWSRLEADGFQDSPHAGWMRRLVRFDAVLDGLLERPPVGQPHAEVVVLFAGHFLEEAPLDHTLVTSSDDSRSVGWALGYWFWPTWLRLLDAMEEANSATHPEFRVPDGLFG